MDEYPFTYCLLTMLSNAFFIVSIGLIAQEVMSFKASKEQALGTHGGLRRAASLSAADRNATTSAAKEIPRNASQREPAIAEEAVPNHHQQQHASSSAMEVDEDLERELSGQQAVRA